MRTIRHLALHWFIEAMFAVWPAGANPPTWALNITEKAVDRIETDHRAWGWNGS